MRSAMNKHNSAFRTAFYRNEVENPDHDFAMLWDIVVGELDLNECDVELVELFSQIISYRETAHDISSNIGHKQ
jgi:hypothetical protein